MNLSTPSSLRRYRLGQTATLVVACLLTILAPAISERIPPLQALELSFRDSVQHLFAKPDAPSTVALVDIDEESIKQIGAWPWPRQRIADLAQTLLEQGARIVVLDMVFPEPRDLAGDKRLLELAQKHQVVLAQVFDYVNRPQPNLTGAVGGRLDRSLYPTLVSASTPAFGHIANHELLQSAPCVGNIGFIPDNDGKIRRLELFTSWRGDVYPALGLATLTCLDETILQGREKPLSNPWILRMDRLDSSWSSIPAHALLDHRSSKLTQDPISGKIVIVGSSALGLSDRVATPLSASTSGMFVHAHAIEDLLQQNQQGPTQGWLTTAIGLALLGLITWLLTAPRPLKTGLLFSTLGIILWAAFITREALLVSPEFLTAPMMGLLTLAAFHLPIELSRARREVRATVNLLSRYVARPVLQELLKAGSFDPLKLRQAEITVVVVDMIDYSKTIECLDLETSALVTRGFLECLTEPVWSSRGTLDRYTGDGLVAFWGAPLAESQHAERALTAVRGMQANITRFNESLAQQNLPPLAIRVGIASGDALVGDFGTRYRATYTAVGSCINTAARLENKAKELSQTILVNELFAKKVTFESCAKLGTLNLRGIGDLAVYSIDIFDK